MRAVCLRYAHFQAEFMVARFFVPKPSAEESIVATTMRASADVDASHCDAFFLSNSLAAKSIVAATIFVARIPM